MNRESEGEEEREREEERGGEQARERERLGMGRENKRECEPKKYGHIARMPCPCRTCIRCRHATDIIKTISDTLCNVPNKKGKNSMSLSYMIFF